MTQSALRYQVSIEAAGVPATLAGAPLSMEIIPERGRARRVLMTLSTHPAVQEVERPGHYFIRAALPSGRLICDSATVPDEPNFEGVAVGKAVLDFEEHAVQPELFRRAESLGQIASSAVVKARSLSATAKRSRTRPMAWVADAAQNIGRMVHGAGVAIGSALEGISSRYEQRSREVATVGGDTFRTAPSRPSPAPLSDAVEDRAEEAATAPSTDFDWGSFVRWGSGSAKGSPAERPRMILRREGAGVLGPLGQVAPRSNGPDQGRPVFINVSAPTPGDEVLVAWLPNSTGGSAHVAMDSDSAAHRSGSALLAYNDPEDAVTATLFAYVRKGALEDARIALPALLGSLGDGTAQTKLGPNRATLTAYVLYKFRAPQAEDLIAVLLGQYPEVADAHVLKGAQLVGQGKAEKAIEHFEAAMARGVPIYTEGVRLLRDGSNFLRDLYPKESHLGDNARWANCIAAAANFASELTCLRLGRDITVDFGNFPVNDRLSAE